MTLLQNLVSTPIQPCSERLVVMGHDATLAPFQDDQATFVVFTRARRRPAVHGLSIHIEMHSAYLDLCDAHL